MYTTASIFNIINLRSALCRDVNQQDDYMVHPSKEDVRVKHTHLHPWRNTVTTRYQELLTVLASANFIDKKQKALEESFTCLHPHVRKNLEGGFLSLYEFRPFLSLRWSSHSSSPLVAV